MRLRIGRAQKKNRRAGAARRLASLVGALIIVVGVVNGVFGNLVADVLPEPGPYLLVGLFVGGVLLWVGLAGWKELLDNRVAAADAVPGVDPRNRPRLLKQVQDRAEQYVRQSLHHAVLELGLETRSDVTEFPEDLLVRRIGQRAARPVPPGQAKLATFEQLDEAMLVLGSPGAGKSVWLNQLAIELVQRATMDPTQPIPVVVNLASWAPHREPLDQWLIEEVALAYQMHPGLATKLVQADQLLPLLDGLDEVRDPDRAACVRAINSYQQTRARHGGRVRPLVVCSRRAEAEALVTRLTRLRLTGAVTLQPLSRDEAVSYLVGVGASEVLKVLFAQPKDDPDLWALLRSPLTLDIIALARTRAAAALRQPASQRLDALLDAYIDTLLTAPENDGRLRPALAAWPPEQSRGWLAWLATSMSRHAQVEFYLERLQPTWLPSHRARRVVQRSPGLVGGLLLWMSGGLIGWQVTGRVFGLAGGLFIGLALGLVGALLVGLTARQQIQPVETLRWSWFEGLARGLLGMLSGGLVMGLFAWQAIGLAGGLVIGRGMGLVIGVLCALGGGLIPGTLETTTRPNQGIRRSVRYSVLSGFVLGLVGGLAGWLVSGWHIVGQITGQAGLLTGLLGRGGVPVIQHYTLRLLLVRMGGIPRPYVRFLNAACDNLLLRRVGGGYRFPHRLLQERFATYLPAAPVAPAPRHAQQRSHKRS